ncbi:hypothetical protein A0H81_10931 [Grifola frondosa]|uniref:Uncharacterized protein n=1 Tax=Grifola frondosa TaxID=5627 RepID=A0A1C7LWT6_GRIFR|nr:hypothetical protein A0H81_10931 [Grifola frondosa]
MLPGERLALLRRMTAEIYSNETDSIKEEIAAEVENLQRIKSAKPDEKGITDLDKLSPELIQQTIDDLPGLVNQFLQEIVGLTDWRFSIIGGGPMPKEGGIVRTFSRFRFHVGRNSLGLDFSQVLGDFQKLVIVPYAKFLGGAGGVYPPEICLQRALTSVKEGSSDSVSPDCNSSQLTYPATSTPAVQRYSPQIPSHVSTPNTPMPQPPVPASDVTRAGPNETSAGMRSSITPPPMLETDATTSETSSPVPPPAPETSSTTPPPAPETPLSPTPEKSPTASPPTPSPSTLPTAPPPVPETSAPPPVPETSAPPPSRSGASDTLSSTRPKRVIKPPKRPDATPSPSKNVRPSHAENAARSSKQVTAPSSESPTWIDKAHAYLKGLRSVDLWSSVDAMVDGNATELAENDGDATATPVKPDGVGWGPLRKGGPTGFVLIMVGLAWWGVASDASQDWLLAVDDVNQSLKAIAAAPTTAKRVASSANAERPSKRARK